jgi:nitrate reductase alpha subunit
MADAFDLERLRVNSADLQRKPKRKKWRRHYTQFPWAWAEQMKSVRRGSTYRLALLLLYEDWRTGGRSIVLSNAGLEQEGLTRKTKWRALLELEQLGLVKVERRLRKSPRVTLRGLPRETS